MTAPSLRPAELDDTALTRLKQLEDRIGGPLVAYRPESPYAPLSEEQLAELRRTETELGVQLLAYRS
ncbi:hypothetical protein SAMN05216207_1012122 [Pseudonocardia ammonioxydans]|uniref:Uncharacterized protein n=1 Tax=Pseudonocardia ammonioxydans TaxID=260086 RepID=A0A1I4Y1G8_PSUAM|nr:hypothetical protein [Pseudonocardia ammonioxydans]SFN31865.1 hypothetical protein SAMN05216207_1012122 [Pseudonocardia ammonioxydans]